MSERVVAVYADGGSFGIRYAIRRQPSRLPKQVNYLAVQATRLIFRHALQFPVEILG